MNSATSSPATPSTGNDVYCPHTAAASTTAVAAVSERLSAAVAAIEGESMRFAILRLNQNIHSFIAIAAESMPTATHENCASSGAIIFSAEDLPSSSAINIISIETISPVTYSILPCPKGCSLSGFLPAILNPISVITDDAASERLLSASPIIATEAVNMPAVSLPATSSILSIMPVSPESLPHAPRTAGSSLSPLGTNSFKSSSLMCIYLVFQFYHAYLAM